MKKLILGSSSESRLSLLKKIHFIPDEIISYIQLPNAISYKKKIKSVVVMKPEIIQHKDCDFHTLEQGGGTKTNQVLICH